MLGRLRVGQSIEDSPFGNGKWVIRVVLAVGRLLPVYSDELTFAVINGMSQMGHGADIGRPAKDRHS